MSSLISREQLYEISYQISNIANIPSQYIQVEISYLVFLYPPQYHSIKHRKGVSTLPIMKKLTSITVSDYNGKVTIGFQCDREYPGRYTIAFLLNNMMTDLIEFETDFPAGSNLVILKDIIENANSTIESRTIKMMNGYIFPTQVSDC